MKNTNLKSFTTRSLAIVLSFICLFSLLPTLNASALGENMGSTQNSAKLLDVLRKNNNLPEINSENPYNEIDGIVFSTLAYLPLNAVPKLGSKKNSVTIEQFANITIPALERKTSIPFFEEFLEESHTWDIYLKYSKDGQRTKDIIELLKLASTNTRYKNIKMGDAYCEFYKDSNGVEQFAGLVYTLSDNTKVVTYRGTDGTLAGWKENIDIAWSDNVNCQQLAKRYLSTLTYRYADSKIAITGHSKGGNLAIYSSLMLINSGINPDRIVSVYNFDGPGLRKDTIRLYDNSYAILKTKLVNFVPQNSIVGMLLNNKDENAKYECIYSSYNGIMQHDSFSWYVNKKFLYVSHKFQIAEGNTTNRKSQFIESIMKTFLSKLNYSEIEIFSNTLFRCMGYEDTSSIMLGPTVIKNLKSVDMLLALFSLDREEKRVFTKVMKEAMNAIMETNINISDNWKDILDMIKNLF